MDKADLIFATSFTISLVGMLTMLGASISGYVIKDNLVVPPSNNIRYPIFGLVFVLIIGFLYLSARDRFPKTSK